METNKDNQKKDNQKVEDLKRVLQIVAFTHHKLLTTQFYPEEFENGKSSLEWLQSFAKKIDQQIIELDPEIAKKVKDQKAEAK